jgi:hypothetical protein
LDPHDIIGDGENAAQIPKFTMKEAIANLLLVEDKVARNKKDDKRRITGVPACTLLKYFQRVSEGNLKMVAFAEAALSLSHKKEIRSYKAFKKINTLANSCHTSFSTL